jgi:diguanylate cyclase (GGDEF)-like protein/PAS domain S-box-containing protein
MNMRLKGLSDNPARTTARSGFVSASLFPWLVLLICLAVTWSLWRVTLNQSRVAFQDYFDFRVRQAVELTEQRILAQEQVLRGVRGLFSASRSVTRQEFATYVKTLHLDEHYPGILGVGYAQVVRPSELNRYIADVRKESGYPEFHIWPEGTRDLYTSIIYLEPFSWRNRRAFGFDMYSEPVRHEAMDRSRDTGKASLSGKVLLVQETDKDVQAGFLIYLPVYRNGMPNSTVQERRKNLLGWVYSPLRMNDLAQGIYGERAQDLDIEIYDGTNVSSRALMYDSNTGHPSGRNSLHASVPVVLSDRVWTLNIGSTRSLEARFDNSKASIVAFAGTGLSALFAFLSWMLLNGRSRAVEYAKEMTRELSKENEKNRALLRNASDGIHILDAKGHLIEASDSFCAMLGYDRSELMGMHISAWDDKLSAEEIDRNLQKLLLGKARIQFETRHRRKDGTKFDVELSSVALELEGKPALLSISRDITERKSIQEKVNTLNRYFVIFLENTSDFIYYKDENSRFIFCSQTLAELTGHASWRDMIGKHDLEVFPEETARIYYEEELPIFRDGVSIINRIDPYIDPKGGKGWVSTCKWPQIDADGKVRGIFGVSRDITATRDAEQQLRIAATVFNAQEGMTVTDEQGTILRVNHAFTKITGYSAEEVVGQNPRILKSGRQGAEFYAAMWQQIVSKGLWEGEIWNRRKNGEIYPEYLTITAVKDTEGKVTNYVATFNDITLSKASLEEIKTLAFYDPLTRLPNRRLLMDRLGKVLASNKRSGNGGAILFLDLDHFKNLNDTLGHDYGDLLLQQVTERLKSCVREGDTVARLGGDEFVVMLEDLSGKEVEAAAQAESIATKILTALNQPYQLGTHIYSNTSSIGIALIKDGEQGREVLLKQADIAMYQSKSAGRNTISFFDPVMQQNIDRRVALESDMWAALEQNQFVLFYQIQVDEAGRAVGAEALIRWQHPERGWIMPSEFIPAAEEAGLITAIGSWVLDAACAQLRTWKDAAPTNQLKLSVNVSAKQFHQPQFVTHVRDAVDRHQVDPTRLKLELTESLLLVDIDDTVAKMTELTDMGIQFSLDDFGTGFSSLQYLKRLPIGQLKIDQTFVRDLMSDESDKTIVQTIIAMAEKLNLEVIAEGVETVEQRDVLLASGCRCYQGYLFGRPQPIDEFNARLGVNQTEN